MCPILLFESLSITSELLLLQLQEPLILEEHLLKTRRCSWETSCAPQSLDTSYICKSFGSTSLESETYFFRSTLNFVDFNIIRYEFYSSQINKELTLDEILFRIMVSLIQRVVASKT